MAYYPFTEQQALDYIRALPELVDGAAELTCREIGDGNLNLVFRISGGRFRTGSGETVSGVIVKQALPHLRVLDSWPLTLHRAEVEHMALLRQKAACPERVPDVYHFNKELALIVMQDLNDYVILRKGLISRTGYPHAADHIGRFLAATLFACSDLGMDPGGKKRLAAAFVNPELCKISEDLIFTDPFHDARLNRYNEYIEPEVRAVWQDRALKLEAAQLKQKFMTEAQALLHGDLHTGSIMVNERETKVIDPEFAFFGPMGFDIGAVLGNLLLNYAAQPGYGGGREMEAYRAEVLEMFAGVWSAFERAFTTLWTNRAVEHWAELEAYRKRYVAQVFADSLGFAGCKMIRRIIGLAHVEDMERLEDAQRRAECERAAIRIGRALMLQRHRLSSMPDVIRAIQRAADAEGGTRHGNAGRAARHDALG